MTVLVRREALLGGEQLPAGGAGDLLPAVDLGVLQETALTVGLKVVVVTLELGGLGTNFAARKKVF